MKRAWKDLPIARQKLFVADHFKVLPLAAVTFLQDCKAAEGTSTRVFWRRVKAGSTCTPVAVIVCRMTRSAYIGTATVRT